MVAITKTNWNPEPEQQPERTVSRDAQTTMCPFTVRIDNMEQSQWNFTSILDDKSKSKGGRDTLIIVPTIKDSHLAFGDYAIVGLEDHFRIERKSKEDMYGTIAAFHQHAGEEKKKVKLNCLYEPSEHWFARQLAGLNSLNGYGHVITECTFPEFLRPPSETRFTAKSASRTILSWMQSYPMVHFHFPGSKQLCATLCFRLMQKFYDHHQRKVTEK